MNTTKETEKTLPTGSFKTKLKFTRSEQTGLWAGYVSEHPYHHWMRGVGKDSPYPKKICIVDAKLAYSILPNVLYDVTCIPMKEKDGYVVIQADPHQFVAKVETTYVPKAIYVVTIKFGNKTFVFDPKDGNRTSMRKLSGVLGELERRVDIRNQQTAIEEFTNACKELIHHYKADGFYYAD